MRAHFNRPLLDPQGNQGGSAQVRVLVPHGTDLIPDLLFADDSSGTTLPNPFTISNGIVDFYLAGPRRVRLGITVGAQPEVFLEDVDVIAAGTESAHPGDGAGSVQVGLDAVAGVDATAAGVLAQAPGERATAVGSQSSAVGDQSVALGSQALAPQPGGTALGASASATGSQSTALGSGAVATYDQTTAIGAGAQATEPNQVILGTGSDKVEVPSGQVVLHSPNGSRFVVCVTDDGTLYAQDIGLPVIPPDPDEDGGSDGGI